jgi:hypothetical protein
MPHVGIRAGGSGQSLSLPRPNREFYLLRFWAIANISVKRIKSESVRMKSRREEERSAMYKTIAVLVMAAAILGLVVRVSRGQVATTSIKPKEIRQGDILNMNVFVDRAPNRDGSLTAYVGPIGGTDQLPVSCQFGKGSTECQVGTVVPLDAKLGKWTVKRIVFQASGGSERNLAKKGRLDI